MTLTSPILAAKPQTKLDPEHQKALDVWQQPYLEQRPDLVELRKRILRRGGGGEVLFCPGGHAPPPSEEISRLLTRGEVLPGKAKFVRMQPCRCHDNCVELWRQGAGDLMNGYALTKDGLWREHSWIKSPDGLVETTVPRLAYYGAVLTPEEIKREFQAAAKLAAAIYAHQTEEAKQSLRQMLGRCPEFPAWLQELLGDDAEYQQIMSDRDDSLKLDYLSDYLKEEKTITVRDDGACEFWRLDMDDAEDVIGNLPVVLYHFTSDKILKKLRREGLRADAKSVNPYQNSRAGVYLTTESCGRAVDGYRSRARNGHGGKDICVPVKTQLHALSPDPDDADIQSGSTQFILPHVPPQNILWDEIE